MDRDRGIQGHTGFIMDPDGLWPIPHMVEVHDWSMEASKWKIRVSKGTFIFIFRYAM